MSAINWLSAWLLFLLIMVAIVQTKVGRPVVYYLLWLAVLFLVVSHYQEINNIFVAGGIVPAQEK